MVDRLQQAVVHLQVYESCQLHRICKQCPRWNPIKDYRLRKLDTVFGRVCIDNPRIISYPCEQPDLAVITDGAHNTQSLPHALPFPTKSILDRFHISMRVRHLEQIVSGLWPKTETERATKKVLGTVVTKLRWCFWHANQDKAQKKLQGIRLQQAAGQCAHGITTAGKNSAWDALTQRLTRSGQMARHHMATIVVALTLALTGCASPEYGKQIGRHFDYKDPSKMGYSSLRPKEGASKSFFVVAFSGGGVRAAALAYGVLLELKDTLVKTSPVTSARSPEQQKGPCNNEPGNACDVAPHALIDEIDQIRGVSGGSFTALAYGLYGDALLCRCDDLINSLNNQPSNCVVTKKASEELFNPGYVKSLMDECSSDPTLTLFEWQFLKRNVQRALILKVANPLNWPTLAFTSVGRSDLAEEYYDDILFQKKTYKDLINAESATNKPRPRILASATDLASGARIVFAQDAFASFCSNLEDVRLARAAAASAAYPVFLSPVTLENFAGHCDFHIKPYLEYAYDLTPQDAFSIRAQSRIKEMERIETLTGENASRYLHLVDGGISDNLGVRSVLENIEMLNGLKDRPHNTWMRDIERFAVIVVDASAEGNTEWASQQSPPSIYSQLKQEVSVPMDRYTREQIGLMKDLMKQKSKDRSTGRNIDFYPIHVSFDAIEDDKEDGKVARYFNNLPTNFHLDDDLRANPPPPSLGGKDAVDRVVERGRKRVRDNCEFQRLVQDMGGNPCKSPCRCK